MRNACVMHAYIYIRNALLKTFIYIIQIIGDIGYPTQKTLVVSALPSFGVDMNELEGADVLKVRYLFSHTACIVL